MCVAPTSATDSSCVLRGYERSAGRYVVILERRPPGERRVAVTLRDNGMRVEVAQLEPE